MMLTIKYFGMLTEVTQCNEEKLESSAENVASLVAALHEKYPRLQQKKFRIVQNKVFVTNEMRLTGEELALLPPFAGG